MDEPDMLAIENCDVSLTYGVKTTWQPIETGPKDGSWVLLFSTHGGDPFEEIGVGFWDDLSPVDGPSCWVHDLAFDPTHWMPLPKPPVALAASFSEE